MIEVREYQAGDLNRIFGREYEIALRRALGPRDFERDLFGSPAFTAWADGVPVFAGGVVVMWPGVGEAWLHLSRWFETHPLSGYRIVRRKMEEIVQANRLRRLQAPIHAGMEPNLRLVEHLGFVREGVMRKWGPDGADYAICARIEPRFASARGGDYVEPA